MYLTELIAALENVHPARVLPLGFGNPHSYRGYYKDLAFEPIADVSVGEMLTDAKAALGATFHGWKGGEYVMRDYTRCWLANHGDTGETLGPVLLALLLSPEPVSDEEAQRRRQVAYGNERWTPGVYPHHLEG